MTEPAKSKESGARTIAREAAAREVIDDARKRGYALRLGKNGYDIVNTTFKGRELLQSRGMPLELFESIVQHQDAIRVVLGKGRAR